MTHIKPLLNDDEIYAKIEQLYIEKPKFIVHIIMSSYPIGKLTRVESFLKAGLSNRLCCLSNQRLIDIYHVAIKQAKEENLRLSALQSQLIDIRTPISMIEQYIQNRKVALIGKKTDKMVCLQAYSQLGKFIIDYVAKGDTLITKTVMTALKEYFQEESAKRFDLSVNWYHTSKETQEQFRQFVYERIQPGFTIYVSILWDVLGNHKHLNYLINAAISESNKTY